MRWFLPLCLAACSPTSWVLKVEPVDDSLITLTTNDSSSCATVFDRVVVHYRKRGLWKVEDGMQAATYVPWAHDLVQDDQLISPELNLSLGRYGGMQLETGPPLPGDEGTEGFIGDVLLGEMADHLAGLYVEGTITCDTESVQFEWFLRGPLPQLCYREDLVAGPGRRLVVPMNFDASNLFTNQLGTPNASTLMIEWLRADTDGDGLVTMDELDAQRLVDLPLAINRFGNVRTLLDYTHTASQHLTSMDEASCTRIP